MATKQDLMDVATSLATTANELATVVTQIPTGTVQIVDQPTLDAVVTSLQGTQASAASSVNALKALVPPA